MPSNDQDVGLQGNFLDDFYAECDEHVLEVRRTLLLLERETGKNEVNAAALDPLFRNIHSLNGNSARWPQKLSNCMEITCRALLWWVTGLYFC